MKFLVAFFTLVLVLTILSCSDNSSDPGAKTGTILVKVIDISLEDSLVAGVAITLLPDSLVKFTEENGTCIYEVLPGDYYVDASLPGPGPAPRKYHEPVTISADSMVVVKFFACELCQ